MTVKISIWVAFVISVATYIFWPYMPKGSFYVGNAFFILILCGVIYLQNKKLFISFYLLCIAFNNLLDELLFNPKQLGLNEILFAILIPIFYYARQNNTRGIFRTFYKNSLSRFFDRSGWSCN